MKFAKFASVFLVLFAVGIIFHDAWTYSGLYRRAVEWQLAHGGSYDPVYTVAAIALVYVLVLGVVITILFRQAGATPDMERIRTGLRDWTTNARGMKYRIAFLLAGIGISGEGALDLAQSYFAGPRVDVDIARIEAGDVPRSRWLVVRGNVILEGAVKHGRKNETLADHYYPIVSGTWQPGKPVAMFLTRDGGGLQKAGETFEGMVSFSGLPGPVRGTMENSGFPSEANALVLRVDKTPSALVFDGVMFLGMGTAMLVGVGIAHLVARRRNQNQNA